MDLQIIISQMPMLFAMMLIGYIVWALGWFDEPAYQKLSKIVVNIFNPILVLNGVMGKDASGDISLILQNLGFVLFFYVILMASGFVFVFLLRPARSERRLYRLMTVFPNVAFMGIPVITGIYGTGCMIYIVFYVLGYNLLLYTYGIGLAKKAAEDAGSRNGSGSGGAWKRMLNPGVICAVAAIFVFVLRLSVPAPVVTFCGYMGNATIPLSMMLIGMSIAQADFKTIFANVRVYLYTGMKMLLLPAVMILLLKPLPADSVVFGVFALQLAMPVGSIVTLIAKENGADEICCTNGIVLSTLASLVTIPLVCMLL